jgi:prepilin-type N-terminal cleavage/methylation domain-containing protein
MERQRGFSIIELLVVIFILLVVAAMAVPAALQAVRGLQLRSSAGALAGLMQQTRIFAAKNNALAGYAIRFTTSNGARIAFIDINGDGVYQPSERAVQFSGNVAVTTATPPAAYVPQGEGGTAYANTTILGFSPRGLPCPYVAGTPATCNTPAANYFAFYLTDGQGWAAVAVAKGGRTKVAIWNGGSWQ